MKKKFANVYQFKITLEDIKPKVWRRILVPETYSFESLHIAIQDAMGWLDYHMHEFVINDPEEGYKVNIGMPDEFGNPVLAEKKQKIASYFSKENSVALYTYDFGDSWEHIIKLEKILPRDAGTAYPVCIAGERACPPEDCGGPWGYMDLLEVMKSKKGERYEELMEWLNEEFDPEYFDPEDVVFSDSQ